LATEFGEKPTRKKEGDKACLQEVSPNVLHLHRNNNTDAKGGDS